MTNQIKLSKLFITYILFYITCLPAHCDTNIDTLITYYDYKGQIITENEINTPPEHPGQGSEANGETGAQTATPEQNSSSINNEQKKYSISDFFAQNNTLNNNGKDIISNDLKLEPDNNIIGCMYNVVIHYHCSDNFDTCFNKKYAQVKSMESYILEKKNSSPIYIEPQITTYESIIYNPAYITTKLTCVTSDAQAEPDPNKTKWLTINEHSFFADPFYQETNTDYIKKAEKFCIAKGGSFSNKKKTYFYAPNETGTYNSYFDATCKFSAPDISKGSTRCWKMYNTRGINATQSGAFGYDNYTECLVLPPED